MRCAGLGLVLKYVYHDCIFFEGKRCVNGFVSWRMHFFFALASMKAQYLISTFLCWPQSLSGEEGTAAAAAAAAADDDDDDDGDGDEWIMFQLCTDEKR